MKILHAVEFYSPSIGGAQETVKQLSEHMVTQGHDVTVATTKLVNRRRKTINKVKITEFDIKGNEVIGYSGPDIDKYKRYLVDSNFDIIMTYAAQQWTSDIMFENLDSIKAKKVIVPCGFSALNYWHTKRYFRDMPEWLSKYDAVIFTSKYYQDYYFAKKNNIKNTVIIPNGASIEEFKKRPQVNIRKNLNIPQKNKLITLIGTHNNQKGHSEAINIFNKANLTNATLLIIANNTEKGCQEQCTNLAKKHNTSWTAISGNNNIIIATLDRKDTIASLFSADIFLFPSQIECAPLVIYESMAAGTPFLATDVGNIAEIVNSTGAGVLLPTKKEGGKSISIFNESALLLQRLLKNKTLLAKMGKKGRVAWKKNHTWETILDQYEDVYVKVVATKKIIKSRKPTPQIQKIDKNQSVDVVIPTYNTAKYLTQAITSALAQGNALNNIIVVDDGSTDKTKTIVKSLQRKYKQIKYIYQKNDGLSSARNAGIKISDSEYIAFLDADDVWKSAKIKQQLQVFQKSKYKNLGLVYSEYEDIDQYGKRIEDMGGFRLNKKVKGNVLKYLLEFNYATGSGSGVLVKRQCFERAGLFDENLKACEDWDMWLRIAEKGYQFDYVNKELVSIRRRSNSMQRDKKLMLTNTILFFNKYLNKGYEMPDHHVKHLKRHMISLIFASPKNLLVLLALRQKMNMKLVNKILPNPLTSIKNYARSARKKSSQILIKMKKGTR